MDLHTSPPQTPPGFPLFLDPEIVDAAPRPDDSGGGPAGRIEAAVAAIGCAVLALEDDVETGPALGLLEANLVAVLTGIARDPGIEAAADDLYRAAATFARAGRFRSDAPGTRQLRVLRESASRLRDRVLAVYELRTA